MPLCCCWLLVCWCMRVLVDVCVRGLVGQGLWDKKGVGCPGWGLMVGPTVIPSDSLPPSPLLRSPPTAEAQSETPLVTSCDLLWPFVGMVTTSCNKRQPEVTRGGAVSFPSCYLLLPLVTRGGDPDVPRPAPQKVSSCSLLCCPHKRPPLVTRG